MPRLVLINGAPGAGKSTLTQALAHEHRMTLPVDVDAIKHSLGRWEEDPLTSGVHARLLCLAIARAHLSAGYDVVVAQYLARPDFIEDLATLTERHGARFFEVVLDIDEPTLADRLLRRASVPDRPEHVINNRLVAPTDARQLVASMEALRRIRPDAIWVDARRDLATTLGLVRAELDA